MKTNYDLKMQQIVNNLTGQPKLLLHSCCAPCSSSVISRLCNLFDITVVYYNPNIYPESEYLKRKAEQIRLLELLNVKFLDCDYNEKEFLSQVVGLEAEKEGGARCPKCFMLRLKYTAKKAKEYGFDYFGTTLTISPHKNEQIINLLGETLENDLNVKFLYSDFKKHNGYLNSIKLSKEYNLYRQDYCGCRYSLRNN